MLAGMFRVLVSGREILRRTVVALYVDNCLGLAAQLAFYFFLALFPALLFLVALASFFPLQKLGPGLLEEARWFFPDEVVRILREQLAAISQGKHGGILTFGLLAALWSSSAAMMAIIDTLNRAYGVHETRSWWQTRLLAIVLTVAVAAFIVASFTLVMLGPTAISTLATWMGGGPALAWVWTVIRWPLIFGLIAVAIGLIYYFAPDVEQEWVWLAPGTALATVAWILASLSFKFYVISLGQYAETYGAIGGVMVLLLWLYLTGLAILVGAFLNSEIERSSHAEKSPGERSPGERLRASPTAKGLAHAPLGTPRAGSLSDRRDDGGASPDDPSRARRG
jgi:membrane protein